MAKAERVESGDVDDAAGWETGKDSPADTHAAEACVIGGEAAACSLVYSTYQAAEERENTPQPPAKPKTGRHWGVFNRQKLPLADASSLSLTGGEWYGLAKEIAAEEWPRILENPYPGGFTLFTERADELKQIFVNLATGEDAE